MITSPPLPPDLQRGPAGDRLVGSRHGPAVRSEGEPANCWRGQQRDPRRLRCYERSRVPDPLHPQGVPGVWRAWERVIVAWESHAVK